MKELTNYQKVVAWAAKKGFRKIKANTDAYETPVSYHGAAKDIVFTPDATGRKRTKKSYFEIVQSQQNIKRKISKWKLLSTLAAMKGGKLVLFAPRGNKAFTKRLIKKYNLHAQLVYLPNI